MQEVIREEDIWDVYRTSRLGNI
ncbi:hypothetical protein MPL3356_50006 [Mesorhizobium plurifarium]|uniref:Uncharacterized protein n=1 Tax=Mesorhizobium plurifarium TaxID=69974 RepID=A0A090EBV0_MESPL|nr:hypothetical protein MPL3356_50006 [Mesorhizobium plurifarium]